MKPAIDMNKKLFTQHIASIRFECHISFMQKSWTEIDNRDTLETVRLAFWLLKI